MNAERYDQMHYLDNKIFQEIEQLRVSYRLSDRMLKHMAALAYPPPSMLLPTDGIIHEYVVRIHYDQPKRTKGGFVNGDYVKCSAILVSVSERDTS